MATSIKSIDKRLEKIEKTVVEKGASPSVAAPQKGAGKLMHDIRQKEDEEKQQALQHIYDEIKEKLVPLSPNLAKLVSMGVLFVEEAFPKIVALGFYGLTGQFKLNLLLELINDIMGMLPITFEQLVDYINEVVYLRFNFDREKKEVVADLIIESEMHVKKSSDTRSIESKKRKRNLINCFTSR
jgi:hypothetical protein